MSRTAFATIVDTLKDFYGPPAPPQITDPFEMILHENVAYLVDDARRDHAFEKLKKTIGTHPADILSASPDDLNEQGQVAKLVKAAQIALKDFGGDLRTAIERPIKEAKAALKKFPGIGDPGAEKILLFNRKLAVLALDSNGLRVLTRVGYGKEGANYAATYRSVQQAIEPELPRDFAWLISATSCSACTAKSFAGEPSHIARDVRCSEYVATLQKRKANSEGCTVSRTRAH